MMIEVCRCDVCGEEVRVPRYAEEPAEGWFELTTPGTVADVCGAACLLRLARQLSGLPAVDELEFLYLASDGGGSEIE